MTAERETDAEATVKMPQMDPEAIDIEEIDPDATLVRDDWEATVIRRIAPHVAAVQSEVAEHSSGESRFGWESEGLRRLAHELQKSGV
jgi:hypothetical protein